MINKGKRKEWVWTNYPSGIKEGASSIGIEGMARGSPSKGLMRGSSPSAPRSSGYPLKKGNGSPPRGSNGKNGARVPESGGIWAQVVQGFRRFKWETSKASKEEVKELQERFSHIVVFKDEEIDRAYNRWKATLIGKFMGEDFSLDFIKNKLRIRWNVQGGGFSGSCLWGALAGVGWFFQ